MTDTALSIRDVAAALPKFDHVEPLPARTGTFTPAIENHEPQFKIRHPVSKADGLIRAELVGDCLAPLLPAGSSAVAWVDPTMAADDYDLVAVHLHESWMQRQVDHHNAAPDLEWIATNARHGLPNVAVKTLRHASDGTLWLTCAKMSYPLEGFGRVIGVVRHVELNRVPHGSGKRSNVVLYCILAFCSFVILVEQIGRFL
jgi:hypothetical protein